MEARFQEDIQYNYKLLADFYWQESQPIYPADNGSFFPSLGWKCHCWNRVSVSVAVNAHSSLAVMASFEFALVIWWQYLAISSSRDCHYVKVIYFQGHISISPIFYMYFLSFLICITRWILRVYSCNIHIHPRKQPAFVLPSSCLMALWYLLGAMLFESVNRGRESFCSLNLPLVRSLLIMGWKPLAKCFRFRKSTIFLHSTICPVKSQLSKAQLSESLLNFLQPQINHISWEQSGSIQIEKRCRL